MTVTPSTEFAMITGFYATQEAQEQIPKAKQYRAPEWFRFTECKVIAVQNAHTYQGHIQGSPGAH